MAFAAIVFVDGRTPKAMLALLRAPQLPAKFERHKQVMKAIALIWNGQVVDAFDQIEDFIRHAEVDSGSDNLSALLHLLLAADQTAYVRRLFEDEQFAEYRLRDRFKPFYYALLAQLGESRADDFKRMGPELAETVAEIRATVAQWREKYFGPSQDGG
jgi:hypothetical protein